MEVAGTTTTTERSYQGSGQPHRVPPADPHACLIPAAGVGTYLPARGAKGLTGVVGYLPRTASAHRDVTVSMASTLKEERWWLHPHNLRYMRIERPSAH